MYSHRQLSLFKCTVHTFYYKINKPQWTPFWLCEKCMMKYRYLYSYWGLIWLNLTLILNAEQPFRMPPLIINGSMTNEGFRDKNRDFPHVPKETGTSDAFNLIETFFTRHDATAFDLYELGVFCGLLACFLRPWCSCGWSNQPSESRQETTLYFLLLWFLHMLCVIICILQMSWNPR